MQKSKFPFLIICCISILFITLLTQKALSAPLCTAGQTPDTVNCDYPKRAIDCPSGSIDPADKTKCAPLGNDCNGNSADTCLQKNSIVGNLNNIINFLSAGIGIIVIGVIILGGIQYTLAGDNSTAIQAARQRIINGLLALLAFLFMFAFLQWIIPGGL